MFREENRSKVDFCFFSSREESTRKQFRSSSLVLPKCTYTQTCLIGRCIDTRHSYTHTGRTCTTYRENSLLLRAPHTKGEENRHSREDRIDKKEDEADKTTRRRRRRKRPRKREANCPGTTSDMSLALYLPTVHSETDRNTRHVTAHS